ncbi:tape measure domain-containing protein [Caloramator quimbayensis]|uniref:Tape measure domain-containing protein n=1 Tax=Caloramator quimbayensis TaxID=1147123 RepID=A0A1T4XR18_9CLOT|nr:tape measure domain-containing protein [Caloramator quimbayensis]
MATIRTAIQIHDGMTPGLRSITNALNMTISSFEALQNASHNAVDTASIQAARAELNRAELAFNEIEQQIREANQAQQQFNNDVRNGQGAADGLLGKLKSVAMSIGAAFGAKKIIELTDSMTSTNARLDLMNDGLQTTEELQNMILKSANASRTSYMDTAAAISKLGIMAKDAFSSNAEIVAFTELMNKNFAIGGASIQEQTAAMYQLTQAMAAGKLQGDEFRSIMENAPLLAQSIAEYMGKSVGELKDMSAEGLITADIIKNAMFASADETNAKFAEMPMTIGQIGTVVGNTLLQTFEPVLQGIGRGAQWIYDNWSTLEPIFWGLTAAVGAYATITGIQTAATWLSVAANRALITTMLSNPVLWIAVAIGVLIGMIYKWVQSVGGLEIAWKIAMNGILTAWDWVKIGFFTGVYWVLDLWDKLKLGIMTASVGIQNFMGDMKAGVLTILQNMVNSAIGIINNFINLLNKIPGVSISAIQEVTFGTTAQMENDAAKRAREADLQNYRNQLEAGMAARDAALERMKSDAWEAAAKRQAEISAAQAANAAKAAQDNDFSSMFNNAEAMKNLADTAANTSKMANSMEMSEESLEYLRDIAEQEVINRFTTAEIKVEMGGITNNVSKDTDLDGIIDYLANGLYEAMQVAAEGVHL